MDVLGINSLWLEYPDRQTCPTKELLTSGCTLARVGWYGIALIRFAGQGRLATPALKELTSSGAHSPLDASQVTQATVALNFESSPTSPRAEKAVLEADTEERRARVTVGQRRGRPKKCPPKALVIGPKWKKRGRPTKEQLEPGAKDDTNKKKTSLQSNAESASHGQQQPSNITGKTNREAPGGLSVSRRHHLPAQTAGQLPSGYVLSCHRGSENAAALSPSQRDSSEQLPRTRDPGQPASLQEHVAGTRRGRPITKCDVCREGKHTRCGTEYATACCLRQVPARLGPALIEMSNTAPCGDISVSIRSQGDNQVSKDTAQYPHTLLVPHVPCFTDTGIVKPPPARAGRQRVKAKGQTPLLQPNAPNCPSLGQPIKIKAKQLRALRRTKQHVTGKDRIVGSTLSHKELVIRAGTPAAREQQAPLMNPAPLTGRCDICLKRKTGHCGTASSISACLRRAPADLGVEHCQEPEQSQHHVEGCNVPAGSEADPMGSQVSAQDTQTLHVPPALDVNMAGRRGTPGKGQDQPLQLQAVDLLTSQEPLKAQQRRAAKARRQPHARQAGTRTSALGPAGPQEQIARTTPQQEEATGQSVPKQSLAALRDPRRWAEAQQPAQPPVPESEGSKGKCSEEWTEEQLAALQVTFLCCGCPTPELYASMQSLLYVTSSAPSPHMMTTLSRLWLVW